MSDPKCAVWQCDDETDGDRLLCTHHYNMGSGDSDRTPMPDGRDEAMDRLDAYWRGEYEYPDLNSTESEQEG